MQVGASPTPATGQSSNGRAPASHAGYGGSNPPRSTSHASIVQQQGHQIVDLGTRVRFPLGAPVTTPEPETVPWTEQAAILPAGGSTPPGVSSHTVTTKAASIEAMHLFFKQGSKARLLGGPSVPARKWPTCVRADPSSPPLPTTGVQASAAMQSPLKRQNQVRVLGTPPFLTVRPRRRMPEQRSQRPVDRRLCALTARS